MKAFEINDKLWSETKEGWKGYMDNAALIISVGVFGRLALEDIERLKTMEQNGVVAPRLV